MRSLLEGRFDEAENRATRALELLGSTARWAAALSRPRPARQLQQLLDDFIDAERHTCAGGSQGGHMFEPRPHQHNVLLVGRLYRRH